MTSSAKPRADSGLNAATFQSLLAQLGADPAQAGLRYERLRQRLVIFFLRRAQTSPEDLADEVLDRLARRLTQGELIASLEGYALGIARLVVHEQNAIRGRHAAAEYSLRNVLGRNDTLSEEAALLERRIQAMERCLSLLPTDEANLLSRYHLPEGRQRIAARAQLAASLALSPGALRKRVFHICSELRDCIRTRLARQAQQTQRKDSSRT